MATVQIGFIDVGNFQLAARRWFDIFGDVHHLIVIQIQAGHRIVGFGFERLFFQVNGGVVLIQRDHTVAFGVVDVVGKHGGTAFLLRCPLQLFLQGVAVEDIVPQYQTHTVIADEVFADQKGLRQTIGAGLLRILQIQTPFAAIAQQMLVQVQICRCGNDQDVPDTCLHQGAERVVDHRLVVDRHQLLADRNCHRVQPCAGATSQNNSFCGMSRGHLGLGHIMSPFIVAFCEYRCG